MKNHRVEVLCGLLVFAIIYYYEVFRFNQLKGNPSPFTLTLHSDMRSDCGHTEEEIKHDKQVKTEVLQCKKDLNIFQVQMERQQRLREACLKIEKEKKHKNESRNLNQKNANMIYSDKARVIYCYVPKVACTNWKRVFQVFYGKYKDPMAVNKKKDDIHLLSYQYLKYLTLKNIEKKSQLYYSFLISRHPFQRLVSAYRNKLRNPYSEEFQRRYGSTILRLYRKNLTEREYVAGQNVTFPEFAQYLIRQHHRFGSAGLDEHWRDVYSLCNVCYTKYDFIGDMKTLIDDSNHVLQQLNWHDKVTFPSNATDRYNIPSTEITRSYFEQLTNTTVAKLYAIYKRDFDIFDYNVREFFT